MWIRPFLAGISLVLVSMTPETEEAKKASMPGPEHKLLEYLPGTWDVDVKLWISPRVPPMESKGTSVAESILGGRFVHYTFTGEFRGLPFEERGMTGYDNIEKNYVAMRIDVLSTNVLRETGTYDPANESFTFTGEFKDPMGKTVKSRHIVKVISNDQHKITRYETQGSRKEYKVMELTYTRSQAPAKP